MNFCYICGQELPLGREKFCPNCGEKFESTRPRKKVNGRGSSIAIDDTKGDAFGIGTSGTGNFIGREIGYTVQGHIINLHVNNLSNEVMENLQKIMSVQTQLPSAVTTKEENKKDVTKLTEMKETQQNISNVLHDVEQIENKEGTQIKQIKAGEMQISTDDLFVKNTLARGTELFYEGSYSDALEWYEKAIAKDPKNAEAWYNKALSLEKLGERKEAINYYDKAIQINPDDADSWYNKGLILMELGKHKEAIKCYDKVIQINPDDADAWDNKGINLMDLGKGNEANKCFNKAETLRK